MALKPTEKEVADLALAFMEDPKSPFIWIDENTARDLATTLLGEMGVMGDDTDTTQNRGTQGLD